MNRYFRLLGQPPVWCVKGLGQLLRSHWCSNVDCRGFPGMDRKVLITWCSWRSVGVVEVGEKLFWMTADLAVSGEEEIDLREVLAALQRRWPGLSVEAFWDWPWQ